MTNSTLWTTLAQLKSAQYRWVDLSYQVDEATPHYEGFNDLKVEEVMSFSKEKVCSREYTMVSQFGTHVDSPYHFIEGARTLDKIELEECVLPLCVIDASAKVKANNDYALTVEDIKEWEAIHGEIPEGAFVAMRTDWHKRSGRDLMNKDAQGDCHYPGWSLPALQYLSETRAITAIGHEPSDTDPAITQKTDLWAGELYHLKQDKYQVELLQNLDQLPPKGAIIFCMFPKIKDAPGSTARCFAICPAT